MWLYGDSETSPGILGFLASARKEYKGDRVRVAARWGKPTDESEYMKLIEISRPLDLVANTYKDGKLPGFYAPCETDVSLLLPLLSRDTPRSLGFEIEGSNLCENM